jgi:hypothetical protein
MAKYTVTAEGFVDVTGAPAFEQADSRPFHLIAYVTDEKGKPVTGLKKQNFKLFDINFVAQKENFFVTEMNISEDLSDWQGLYRLSDPVSFQIPPRRTHIIGVLVRKSFPVFKGQRRKPPIEGRTLVSVTAPSEF